MTNFAILAVAGLLLAAYLLEILGRRLRLPSVALLIGAGMLRSLFDQASAAAALMPALRAPRWAAR